MSLGIDPHSFANLDEVTTKKINLNLKIDFERKILFGYCDLDLQVLKDNLEKVLLDGKNISIDTITIAGKDEPLLFTIPKNTNIGFCLNVPLPKGDFSKGTRFTLRIHYSTTPSSGGIQWFEPEQTRGKKYGFVYTQFEAILARSMIPCMDTPFIKCPYYINVSCPDPLVVACSGHQIGEPKKNGKWISYEFEQKVPIPSYLIALTCGALEKAKIGPRSSVWCEKELLEASKYEFSETEDYLKAGEKICGYPYVWETYDLMILPPFFPYGGMENPNLTFLSSSLIAGDRSLTNVVAHEITHSWAGNLVTNQGWNHFWLNEGFTMYIERLILGEVKGEDFRQFEHILGYGELIKTCKALEKTPELTKLVSDLSGMDPDDAFSRIPYEKGCLFLLYLESVVGGKDKMVEWLRIYIKDHADKSLDSYEMKAHFLNHFPNAVVDWKYWFESPGLPNWNPLEYLGQKMNKECTKLTNLWLEKNGQGAKKEDLNWESSQTMVFLDNLINSNQKLDLEILKKIEETYQLSTSRNVEILFRWLMLNLQNDNMSILSEVESFVSKHGRGVYLRPLYKKLIELSNEKKLDQKKVKEIYQKNRTCYHSVIKNSFDKELN